jgi:hypothetical protein
MTAEDTAGPLDATTASEDIEQAAVEVGADLAEAQDVTSPGRFVGSAVQVAEAQAIDANMSAIASARTHSLSATGSAVGIATVDGDAETRLSVVGIVASRGSATVHQTYASAVIAGKDIGVSQGGAPFVLSRTISFEQSGVGAAVANDAIVRRSFIGVLLAGRADVAEDTKVLISGKGLLILAAALFGGLGLVALAILYGSEQIWSRMRFSLPSLRNRHGPLG